MKARKGTVFLDKYTCKSKLGKGAFGDVYLVEDEQKENYALKCISKKKMTGENEHLLDYLESEIDVMKKMDCKHLVKLYEFSEDEDNYFMLMQYCDGGDLINLQVKRPDQVFSLEETKACLKQVVMGLEELHSKGYLHRDIKMQNILVKTQNGQKVYKVGDFGFAKKSNMRETVLGTENFMAPEVYRAGIEEVDMAQQQADYYGYEVDMWSFGVLMYYMLNRSFPFQVNVYWDVKEKCEKLIEQGRNFSYSERVRRSAKCKDQNCTEDMENLFRKIFAVKAEERINFAQIRQHPVFEEYFPPPSEASKILYRTKFKSCYTGKKNKTNASGVAEIRNRLAQKAKEFGGENQSPEKAKQIVPSVICGDDEEGQLYLKEKRILALEVEEIEFLKTVMEEIEVVEGDLGAVPCLMLAYNLLKYHVILFNNFLTQLNAPSYQAKHKGIQWTLFFNSPQFNSKKIGYADRIARCLSRLQQLKEKCQYRIKEIAAINPHFEGCLTSQVQEEAFDGEFFKSFRASTNYFYMQLKKYLKTNKVLRFYYYLTETIICHVYSDFLMEPELRNAMYEEFVATEDKAQLPMISYQGFHAWLRDQEKQQLLTVAMRIIKDCMGS